MVTPCTACPLRKCDLFIEMTEEELAFMLKFKVGEMTVSPGTTILMQGSKSPQLYTALRGMGLRYVTLENGLRQVVRFVFPGDFIGLQAAIMGELAHSVEATTEMTLCVFDRADLWKLYKSSPARGYDVTWVAAMEESLVSEALAAVGQCDATQKIAWCFYRIFERCRRLRMTDGDSCPMPYRQRDLADALGLSLVHTNKTLQRLRETGIAHWSNGRLHVPDPSKLGDLAAFGDDREISRRPLI
jgi:CRP/FNR family transcriptional regulator